MNVGQYLGRVVKVNMQHSKSYIQSEDAREAIGYLYNEIEALEHKIRDLEYEIDKLKSSQ